MNEKSEFRVVTLLHGPRVNREEAMCALNSIREMPNIVWAVFNCKCPQSILKDLEHGGTSSTDALLGGVLRSLSLNRGEIHQARVFYDQTLGPYGGLWVVVNEGANDPKVIDRIEYWYRTQTLRCLLDISFD